MISPDNREFSRAVTHHRVTITSDGKEPIDGMLANISMNGLLADCACMWDAGAPCAIEIGLIDSDLDARIVAKGRVIRSNHDQTCAVEFTEITDLESLYHLQQLLLYNADDADIVDEEIVSHMGIRRGSR